MSNQGAIGGRSRRRIQGLTRDPHKVQGFDVRLLPGDGLRLEAFMPSLDPAQWFGYGAVYRGSAPVQTAKRVEAPKGPDEPPGNQIVLALTLHAMRRIEAGEAIIGFEGVCIETIVLDNLMRLLWPGDYAELCDAPQLQTILSRVSAHMGMRIRDEEYLNDNIQQLTTRVVQEILDALNDSDWRRLIWHGRMT